MALRTLIINNTAYQYPETGYDGRFGNLLPQLQEGSYERILQFDTLLTSQQLTTLGVTDVFDDHWIIEVRGNPTNPATPTAGTMDFVAIEDLNITATGDVGIQSITRSTLDGMRRHQVVITCPNGGKGNVIIAGRSKIRRVGGGWGQFWSNDSTAPYIYMYGALPEQAMQVRFEGANTCWTHTSALPSGLTYIYLVNCPNVSWTYTGAMPSGLTYLYLNNCPNVSWTYTGAMPSGLTNIYLINCPNVSWTYTGAMPSGLTILYLYSCPNVSWTHTGAMPSGLQYIFIATCQNINWTGNTLGNHGTPKPNMTRVELYDYRNPDNPMDYGDLNTLLRCLIDNVGTLPSTVIIREQIPANVAAIAAANPVQDGTPAEQAKWKINWIKANKNVTTFQLNTTNI